MLSPSPVPKPTPLVPLDRAVEVSETSFIHPLQWFILENATKTTFSNGHQRINYRRRMENTFHIFKYDSPSGKFLQFFKVFQSMWELYFMT